MGVHESKLCARPKRLAGVGHHDAVSQRGANGREGGSAVQRCSAPMAQRSPLALPLCRSRTLVAVMGLDALLCLGAGQHQHQHQQQAASRKQRAARSTPRA